MSPEPEELEGWLSKADADLQAARHLRQRPDIPPEIACFHLQQAAEKALKGSGLDATVAMTLTPFATLARYPGFQEQPDALTVDGFEAFAAACIDMLRAQAGLS